VVELSKDVLHESRFKKANPDYVIGKPCVYVGMTGLGAIRFPIGRMPAAIGLDLSIVLRPRFA
jgi:hypothetical protein